MKFKPGDRVSCKLRESIIVNPKEEYDDIHVFEIIGMNFNEEGYYLFVPSYFFVKNSIKVDISFKKFHIQDKYLGDDCIFINEKLVFDVSFILSGALCKRCSLYSDYAESNQSDGSFLCCSCRLNPYR